MTRSRPAASAAFAFTRAPSIADLEEMAERAFDSLPEAFRRAVAGVAIHVEDFPDEDTERDMELESPFELLGLYRGVDLSRKSVMDAPSDLDRIFLYRRPLLDYWCEEDEDLFHLIRHVLIHEIGHHLGLSDDDMDAIEAAADEA